MAAPLIVPAVAPHLAQAGQLSIQVQHLHPRPVAAFQAAGRQVKCVRVTIPGWLQVVSQKID